MNLSSDPRALILLRRHDSTRKLKAFRLRFFGRDPLDLRALAGLARRFLGRFGRFALRIGRADEGQRGLRQRIAQAGPGGHQRGVHGHLRRGRLQGEGRSTHRFGDLAGGPSSDVGHNYLHECDTAANGGDSIARRPLNRPRMC